MTRFEDLVDLEGLDPSEVERLRRVHELLVQAGPPPDLPPALERPPSAPDDEGEIATFPMLPRRRWPLIAVAAAALIVLAFGGGYLAGHAKKKATSFETRFVVPMHGSNAVALLRIAPKDDAGNTPMELEVNNLPQQREGDYYELWLTRAGKAIAPCGTFRVNERTTTVRLSAPYNFKHFEGWVVTKQTPTRHTPGPVVMST